MKYRANVSFQYTVEATDEAEAIRNLSYQFHPLNFPDLSQMSVQIWPSMLMPAVTDSSTVSPLSTKEVSAP